MIISTFVLWLICCIVPHEKPPRFPSDVLAPFPLYFTPLGEPRSVIIKTEDHNYFIKWNGHSIEIRGLTDPVLPLHMGPPKPPTINPPAGGWDDGDKDKDYPYILQLPDNRFLVQFAPNEAFVRLEDMNKDDPRYMLVLEKVLEIMQKRRPPT